MPGGLISRRVKFGMIALVSMGVMVSGIPSGQERGKTADAAGDPARDLPLAVSTDGTVQFDYPIVYVRVPRPYPKEYFHINHLNQAGLHQTNAPGAELRVLYPDGRDEVLVPLSDQESITDPAVSFDGQWVYYAKFHHMAPGQAHMSKLRSGQGSDIYKIHVGTRQVLQLT